MIRIYEENPSVRELQKVVEVLRKGGVVVYPTDSVYALAASADSPKGIEKLRTIKGKEATTFSVVFAAQSQAAQYCRISNEQFKILKKHLPGAFTFLVEASSNMPARALENRKTIGIRIPANAIARAIVEQLGAPLVTTSVAEDEETGYLTDPSLIEERYGARVALVVDGGPGRTEPTTVVDLTGDEPTILRQGIANLNLY